LKQRRREKTENRFIGLKTGIIGLYCGVLADNKGIVDYFKITRMKGKGTMSKSVILTLTFCVFILLQGCAAPTYRLYNGSPLPKEQIAVLKDTPGSWATFIYIVSVDGFVATDKRGSEFFGSIWTGSFRIELLPGTHTLTVRLSSESYGNGITTVTFTAEAGKIYVVNYSIGQVNRTETQMSPMSKAVTTRSQWRAWVEEVAVKN
jgi:hypothetical protein